MATAPYLGVGSKHCTYMTESDETKYYGLLILINLGLATLPHLLIRPMWYNGVDSFTNATTIELAYTALILPLSLVICNHKLNTFYTKPKFYINAALIIISIWLSKYMHFKNWADIIGSWDNPDRETIMVMNMELYTGWIISIIGIAVVMVKLRLNQDSDEKSEI
ncbi:MAG: hypothetical protein RIA69_12490 [Cyclobacteriaceae bacterium]